MQFYENPIVARFLVKHQNCPFLFSRIEQYVVIVDEHTAQS